MMMLLSLPARAGDEKFWPRTLKGSKLIACGVGGGQDGYAEAFVIVQFKTGPDYVATIAKRPDAWTAIKDCAAWLKSLEEPLEKSAKEGS